MGNVVPMNRPQWIGRYEVEEVIGSGAAGVVYLARDPLIDRMVAVKVLRSDVGDRSASEMRIRFLREARAAGRLSHPNIVTVYDVGEDTAHENAFIAMEFLEGSTLKEFMSRGILLDFRRIAQLAVILANTLDYAHRNGVVHRDVKPANIILTRDGDLKITDFGIARFGSSDLTYDGAVIGTPNYMSPEQISGKPADGRSDLYSLGVILYELVTGERPFAGDSVPELSLNVTTKPVPDPAGLRAGLPTDLSEIILRCLEREPEDRFQSGSEIVDALVAADLSVGASAVEGDASESGGVIVREPVLDEPEPLTEVAFDFMATRAVQQSLRIRDFDEGSPLERVAEALRQLRDRRWFLPAAAVVGVALLVMLLATTVSREPEVQIIEIHPTPAAEGAGVVEENAAPAAGPAAVATPSGFKGSVLEVVHRNRLGSGYMTLSMDGIPFSSLGMAPADDVAGSVVAKTLFVPAGEHAIGVRIVGEGAGVDVTGSIDGRFTLGERRRLEVTLDPTTHQIGLSWAR